MFILVRYNGDIDFNRVKTLKSIPSWALALEKAVDFIV